MNGSSVFRVSLLSILGMAVLGSTIALSNQSKDYKFFDPLIEVKHLIDRKYAQDVDLQKLQDGAISGMIEALNDPYTVYVPASQTGEFTKQLTGEYVGIGAQVNVQEGWLTIVSPLEDSPAYRSGIMPEDRVIEIEGESTKGLPVDKCVEKLMGEPGTKVHLVIERKGEKIPMEITRERIKTRSVKGFRREDADGNKWMHFIDPANKIAYLRITQFTPRVSDEVEAALKGIGADKGEVKGLVLDLRGNPGGVLSDAVEIADLFLESGVIVSTKGRSHPEEVARARAAGTLPNFPLAILLDGQSASASEVLAGALVENNRAIVVGTRSYGKGSVQTVHPLERAEGAELKLTEQGYYLPSGRSLSRKDDSAEWGVNPTDGFFVPMSDDELIAMYDVRRRVDLLRRPGPTPANVETPSTVRDGAPKPAADAKPLGREDDPVARAQRIDAELSHVDWSNGEQMLTALKDKQLSAAVHGMQGKLSGGEWTKTGEALPTGDKGVAGYEVTKLYDVRDRIERELDRVDKRIDALEKQTGGEVARADALLPEKADLKGGSLRVLDKDGKEVAVLEITSAELARWLVDAPLKKAEEKK